MIDEPRATGSSGAAGWIGILAGLAGAVVLFGMRDTGNVDVFGLDVPIILVGLLLWFLGFFAGFFNRRRIR